MFAKRKKLNYIWMAIATLATISMVAFLFLPLIVAGR